jgi:type IV fimbrial biogenesis protein FimT
MMSRRLSRGLTIVELLVAVAITAILVGLATPSFRESIARSRLDGAVSTFAVDLQYTRAEAIRAGVKRADMAATAASIVPTTNGYRVVTSPAFDGGTTNTVKTVTFPDGVKFTGLGTIAFDGLRGTTGAHTIQVTSDYTSAKLTVSTNALGRVSVCSPSGTFPGYPSC